MRIPDDTLADDAKYLRHVQQSCNEASGWGRTPEQKRIKLQFWRAPKSVFAAIPVAWDTRPKANRINNGYTEFKNKCKLYKYDSCYLLTSLSNSETFSFPRIFDECDENAFLRVIYYWISGVPLTPPLLVQRPDGLFFNADGFHRLAVAFATGVPEIMFWGVLQSKIRT